jgi:predicted DNA-binding transcriptional regulator YafY
MSKVERLYHLHNILDQRRTPISRQDLMERLECSQATLYRLVGELRDFLGAPIEQDPDTRGFYYDRSYEQPFDLPGIWISPGELQALLTARQVLANVQPGLLEGELESLQGRITSLLQKKGVEPESGESRIHIQHVAGRAVPARMFQDVLAALIRRQRLNIRYHGRRKDEESERGSFALERIRQQSLADEAAREVSPSVLSAHFDQSYGIFSGPAEHVAELRFSPETARWISEESWHPDQQGAFEADGSWLLKVPFSNARELIMDVLRYGAEAEVLAPDFLRDAVAAEALKTTEIYR